MKNSLVSVIIPTYKRPDKLDKAMNSVIKQTYNNWELIIVDDNNQDDKYRQETKRFIKKYLRNPKIKYIKHKKNKVGAAARNTGIKNAQGEFIAFLDDDDKWYNSKLEKQVRKISNNNTNVVYTGFKVIDEKLNQQIKIKRAEYNKNMTEKLCCANVVGTTSTVIIQNNCLKQVGGFDESLLSCQDWDLWIRLAKMGYRFDYIREPLVKYYVHKNNRITNDSYSVVKGHIDFHKKHIKLLENQAKKVKEKHFLYLGNKMRWERELKKSVYFYKKALFNNPFNFKYYLLLIICCLSSNIYDKIIDVKNKLAK
jgi:glycosyltransferase involved in cell wall biosynthesis